MPLTKSAFSTHGNWGIELGEYRALHDAQLEEARKIARKMLAALDDGAVGKLVEAATLCLQIHMPDCKGLLSYEEISKRYIKLREALKPWQKEGA